MTALQWMNDLVQWFGRLIPRLTMVPPTHAAVRFGPMGGAAAKGSGLVFWWPLIHILTTVPTAVQSVQISARPSAAGTGEEMLPRVAIKGVAVQYRVADPVKAAVNVMGLAALIDNRCQAALGGVDGEGLAAMEQVQRRLARELRPYGVQVEAVDRTHSGHVVALLHHWDESNSDAAEKEVKQ